MTQAKAAFISLVVVSLVQPVVHADELPGFKLDGERWTYKDDKITMDGILLKPEGKGPFPAMLISHGKGGAATGFGANHSREFAKWGLVCIAPNYTHAGGQGKPGEDGASAENIRRAMKCLDILESRADVDKTRMAAYGHSMGGFVTIATAATAPARLRAAVITGSGVAPKAGFPAPSTELADKIRTPFLIMHGDQDRTVRQQQSAMLQDILDKNKVACKRHVFAGEGHAIDQTQRTDVYKLIRQWLSDHEVLSK